MGVKRSRSDSLSSSEDPSAPFTREASADVKIVHLDAETALSKPAAVMECSLPPHQPLTFASIQEYEVHYQKTHMNRCSECHKNFPDEHFLHLHIAENHDPISAAKKDRGEKTYACLIPTCDRLCSTPQKRRLHCIDKHSFPRNYDFFIVNDGIDRRSSMLRRDQHRRRSSTIGSTTGNGHRRRSSTMGSISGARAGGEGGRGGEGMDVVNDEDEDEEEDDDDEDEDEDTSMMDGHDGPKSPQRAPIKLHGRGGFGHGRGRGRGRGRGNGRGRGTTTATNPTPAAPKTADPVDSLTSGMSALQFVPHSVRVARGRGRGGVA